MCTRIFVKKFFFGKKKFVFIKCARISVLRENKYFFVRFLYSW